MYALRFCLRLFCLVSIYNWRRHLLFVAHRNLSSLLCVCTVWVCIFCQKEISAKAAHKMLLKLTIGWTRLLDSKSDLLAGLPDGLFKSCGLVRETRPF